MWVTQAAEVKKVVQITSQYQSVPAQKGLRKCLKTSYKPAVRQSHYILSASTSSHSSAVSHWVWPPKMSEDGLGEPYIAGILCWAVRTSQEMPLDTNTASQCTFWAGIAFLDCLDRFCNLQTLALHPFLHIRASDSHTSAYKYLDTGSFSTQICDLSNTSSWSQKSSTNYI